MITFLIILYCLAAFAAATLSLINIFSEESYPDCMDKLIYAILALGMGLAWPLTIWVALVLWYSSGRTPAWVEALQNLRKFISKKEEN